MLKAKTTFSDRILFSARYSETDQMGVVNHSRYFDWFSEGRVAWLSERGHSYNEWEREGWFLPVIDASCNYRKGVFFQDEVELQTRVSEFNPRKVTFNYRLTKRGKNEILAEGVTVHFFVYKGKLKKLDRRLYEVFYVSER